MHQDSFKSKPATKEYTENYKQIDWSKPLGKSSLEKKDETPITPTFDYSKNETIDIEEWLANQVKNGDATK